MSRPVQKPETLIFKGIEYLNAAAAAENFDTTPGYLRFLVTKGKLNRSRLPGKGKQNFYAAGELSDLLTKTRTKHEPKQFEYAADI